MVCSFLVGAYCFRVQNIKYPLRFVERTFERWVTVSLRWRVSIAAWCAGRIVSFTLTHRNPGTNLFLQKKLSDKNVTIMSYLPVIDIRCSSCFVALNFTSFDMENYKWTQNFHVETCGSRLDGWCSILGVHTYYSEALFASYTVDPGGCFGRGKAGGEWSWALTSV